MFELFQSKKNKVQKAFQFKTDQQGIYNRFSREQDIWGKHLELTRRYIETSSQGKPKNLAVVLGSGWLLDVPIDELSNAFKDVVLIDISHPRQIASRVSKLGNVQTIERDLTGLAEKVFDWSTNKVLFNKPETLLNIEPEPLNLGFSIIEDADFVVSVNLLSQLDILITDYLRLHGFKDEAILLEFQKKIQENHLSFLPSEKTCLITDYIEHRQDDQYFTIEKKNLLLANLPAHRNKQTWQWVFDTHKTYHPKYNIVFEVLAIEI